jgi:hypothetical protein
MLRLASVALCTDPEHLPLTVNAFHLMRTPVGHGVVRFMALPLSS